MKVKKLRERGAFIEADISEIEQYPTWSATQVAHIRINDRYKKRWTDCWLSAIIKGGRIRFDLHHEKGYPSELKGMTIKSITANWISNNVPEIGKEGENNE